MGGVGGGVGKGEIYRRGGVKTAVDPTVQNAREQHIARAGGGDLADGWRRECGGAAVGVAHNLQALPRHDQAGIGQAALLLAVVVGAYQIRSLVLAARQDELAVAMAQGAAAELIQLRFGQWQLTPAEADVALFALKGCDVHEIARMRGAADGTVRAQLTRVYAKAGVSSQSALIAGFVDELIDPAMLTRPPEIAEEDQS